MTMSPLLSPQDWKNLFPMIKYKECQQAEKGSEQRNWIAQHAIKFLIATGQPDKNILDYVSKVNGDSNKLSSKLTDYQFTALHIAAMLGRKEIVVGLLAAGAND